MTSRETASVYFDDEQIEIVGSPEPLRLLARMIRSLGVVVFSRQRTAELNEADSAKIMIRESDSDEVWLSADPVRAEVTLEGNAAVRLLLAEAIETLATESLPGDHAHFYYTAGHPSLMSSGSCPLVIGVR